MVAASLGACRRPLYVAGDEFYSVVLNTDWRQYQSSDPGGKTAWFYPIDKDERCYRTTTANVRRAEIFLPSGRYNGVIIDYSPEEYGKQEFLGMEYANTALVKATPASYQPDSEPELYGPAAFHTTIEPVIKETGLSQIANEPEMMGLDTLSNKQVFGGDYGYYIPYEERDTYQAVFNVQEFFAYPVCPLWRLRIRIYVKGIDYLWQASGSVAGLANGRYLALNHNSDIPCLIDIPEWEKQRTGDNEGYVAATITTFGLLNGQKPNTLYEPFTQEELAARQPAVIADWNGASNMVPNNIRINFKFILRDRATVLYYHFDAGDYVTSYDKQQVLRIDLGKGVRPDLPDLPYVDAYGSTMFDAEVVPWVDGPDVDVIM